MGFLETEWRLAWLGGLEPEGAARNVADPQRPHEFEARQSSQVLGVPFPQLWVLRRLADNGVLHNGVAEVAHYRCNGEHATQPFIQTLLRHGLRGLRVRVARRG